MKEKRYRHQLDREGAEKASANAKTKPTGPSITSQSEFQNTDINVLVKRFGIAPLAQPINPAAYGVWDGELDLATALRTVESANETFMALPARIRERFKNDPLLLLEAIKDESRHDELRELGVMHPKEKEAPPVVRTDQPSPTGDGIPTSAAT